MKPWTELILVVMACASAAGIAAGLLGQDWSASVIPGALVGLVVFLIRFLSGATPSKGPWADAFLALESRVSRLEARSQAEDGPTREREDDRRPAPSVDSHRAPR